jgi:TonB family protein
MQRPPSSDLYTPREIARAAGVPVQQVVAALGGRTGFVPHADAVRLGRALAAAKTARTPFSVFSLTNDARPLVTRVSSLAVSSTAHAAVVVAAIVVTTFGLSPSATTLESEIVPAERMRLVFMATPGPGGGGGGGGLRQKAPPPKALREGRRAESSPMPVRRPPQPIAPAPAPPEPAPPPLNAEPLPAVVAPIISAPADSRDRAGIFEQARQESDSRGPGELGGVGSGRGTGIGEGDGTGVGPGSGGGTGGGPYRPGSGIEPPRLLREVKADYTEDARRRGIAGDVVLEIVVRRDGSVGDVRILQRLGAGLDERAVQAVRQWRFSPATRHGGAVDVIVEVAVEFKLR